MENKIEKSMMEIIWDKLNFVFLCFVEREKKLTVYLDLKKINKQNKKKSRTEAFVCLG